MKVKKILKEYYWLDKNIKEDKERLEHYRSIAEGTSRNGMSKTPGAVSQGDKMSYFAAKAADLSSVIDRRIMRMMEKENEIRGYIDGIDSELLKRLLILKYLKLMKWHDIADDLGYSLQRTYQLHGEALRAIKH